MMPSRSAMNMSSGLRLAGVEARRLREDGSEPARLAIGPGEERQPERDEERRLDIEQEADGLDAAVDHPHVGAPEEEEADELHPREIAERPRLDELPRDHGAWFVALRQAERGGGIL